jgi:hypothetical protein
MDKETAHEVISIVIRNDPELDVLIRSVKEPSLHKNYCTSALKLLEFGDTQLNREENSLLLRALVTAL